MSGAQLATTHTSKLEAIAPIGYHPTSEQAPKTFVIPTIYDLRISIQCTQIWSALALLTWIHLVLELETGSTWESCICQQYEHDSVWYGTVVEVCVCVYIYIYMCDDFYGGGTAPFLDTCANKDILQCQKRSSLWTLTYGFTSQAVCFHLWSSIQVLWLHVPYSVSMVWYDMIWSDIIYDIWYMMFILIWYMICVMTYDIWFRMCVMTYDPRDGGFPGGRHGWC